MQQQTSEMQTLMYADIGALPSDRLPCAVAHVLTIDDDKVEYARLTHQTSNKTVAVQPDNQHHAGKILLRMWWSFMEYIENFIKLQLHCTVKGYYIDKYVVCEH